jgi:hypothetical protein
LKTAQDLERGLANSAELIGLYAKNGGRPQSQDLLRT